MGGRGAPIGRGVGDPHAQGRVDPPLTPSCAHLWLNAISPSLATLHCSSTGCFTRGVFFHVPLNSAISGQIWLQLDSNDRGSSTIYENKNKS